MTDDKRKWALRVYRMQGELAFLASETLLIATKPDARAVLDAVRPHLPEGHLASMVDDRGNNA